MNNFNHFEKEIKRKVLEYLLRRDIFERTVTVISELTIDSFSRRVDLVVINDSKIIAYEIKSDADSLYRLPGQLDKYQKYFDKVVVVSTAKHIKNILAMVPEDIEVWEVGNNKISIKKRGRIEKIDTKDNYLDLLKVSDMKKLANIINVSANGGKGEVKKTLVYNLHKINHKNLKAFVLNSISKRFDLTSNAFLRSVSEENKVTLDDLNLLSPYIVTRNTNYFFEDSVIERLK